MIKIMSATRSEPNSKKSARARPEAFANFHVEVYSRARELQHERSTGDNSMGKGIISLPPSPLLFDSLAGSGN